MPTGVYKRKSIKDRFDEKVDKSGNCWIWTGCKDPNGYGQISKEGRGYGAHRVSYEIHRGEIPKGLVIDHLCRNTLCVNPDHLEAVTMAENTRRGILRDVQKSKRQSHCKRGHELSGDNLGINKKGRYCKACQRQKANEWRDKNRKKVRASLRKWRAKKELEKLREYKKLIGMK